MGCAKRGEANGRPHWRGSRQSRPPEKPPPLPVAAKCGARFVPLHARAPGLVLAAGRSATSPPTPLSLPVPSLVSPSLPLYFSLLFPSFPLVIPYFFFSFLPLVLRVHSSPAQNSHKALLSPDSL